MGGSMMEIGSKQGFNFLKGENILTGWLPMLFTVEWD